MKSVFMNPPITISTVEYRPQDEGEQNQKKMPGKQQRDDLQQHGDLSGDRTAPPYAEAAARWGVVAPSSANAATISEQTGAIGPNVPSTAVPVPLPSSKALARNAGGGSAVIRLKRVFKVIIIGDAGVGKTCLSYRFCNGRFPGPTEATIGVDFRERSLLIDDELIRVQLWDTAGQERYRQSIVAHYYRNVNAVVFVYDVFDPKSFRSLPIWIDECRKHALTASDDTPHILIGNKCDLQPRKGNDDASTEQLMAKRVKTDQAQVFADENDMALFETSALADSEADHVESIFLTLVHKLRQSKPMHVQSTEERSRREQQKILLKADEAAKLTADEDSGGICC